jgi:transposase
VLWIYNTDCHDRLVCSTTCRAVRAEEARRDGHGPPGLPLRVGPHSRKQGSLASHAGGAWFAYNWGLELVTTRLDQRAACENVQVPWTLAELRREWNHAKHHVAPWWAENSKEAYNSGLDALARALKNWTDSRNGLRAGRPVGFPRRKTRRHARVACRFTTGQIKVLPDRTHIQLPSHRGPQDA